MIDNRVSSSLLDESHVVYIIFKNKSAVQKVKYLHLFTHTDTDSGIVEKDFAWLIFSVSSSAFSNLRQATTIYH